MYFLWYKRQRVIDGQCNASKNAAALLPKQQWQRASAGMAQELGRTGSSGHWPRPDASAMALPVGMPLCRAMGQGLWEIRTDLPSNRIARVLLCLHEGVLLALHGFIKKTQKTPDVELALARKRQKELKS
jgi:hypothetical protein